MFRLFAVIDAPGIPEKKSFPPRAVLALLMTPFHCRGGGRPDSIAPSMGASERKRIRAKRSRDRSPSICAAKSTLRRAVGTGMK